MSTTTGRARIWLQPLNVPCVIAIDETDSVFRTSFSADFFAMLRSWHGLRAHPVRRSWKNLDIILSTSTEPQFFIDRPHESPFNVGVVLPLEDFLPEQVARLNVLHPRPLGDGDVQLQRGVRTGVRRTLGERSPPVERELHGWCE